MLDTQDCRNYIAGELVREVNNYISLCKTPSVKINFNIASQKTNSLSKSAEYATILLALQSL